MFAALSIGVLSSLVVIASAGQFPIQRVYPSPAPTQSAPKQDPAPQPPSPLVTTPERNPFANLFVTPTTRKMTQTPPSKVICGMTVVKPNPGIDRGMIVPVPPGHFAIRRIEPSICRNE